MHVSHSSLSSEHQTAVFDRLRRVSRWPVRSKKKSTSAVYFDIVQLAAFPH
jgi:hypothetical protein